MSNVRKCIEVGHSALRMSIERLANELILDVFDYLHAIDILQGFSHLNSRFAQLLTTSVQRYHLDFRFVSKQTFARICHDALPAIVDRVCSLHLSDDEETPNLPELFHSNTSITLPQFVHLQSISLYAIRSLNTWNQIISQCRELPALVQLNLLQYLVPDKDNQFIDHIWSLGTLVSCTIDDQRARKIDFSTLSIVSHSIKYLCLKNIDCNLNALSHLRQHTPNLERLCTTVMRTESNPPTNPGISQISSFKVSFYGSKAGLVQLLQPLVNLRSLTVQTSKMLLNGHEWEHLLTTHLPNLERFRFYMDFSFPHQGIMDNLVSGLLETFQRPFWLQRHRWFVRCDWNTTNSFRNAILYTLPYAFEQFQLINQFKSKSTCPLDKDFCSYGRVESLRHENNSIFSSWRFPNIRHLEIMIPFRETSLSIIPSLDRLQTLDVTFIPGPLAYQQLQALLDRATSLYQLKFSHLSDLEMSLFELRNPSIRRLDFFTKESMLYSWYFNQEQCLALADSSLGQQCRTLVMDFKHRRLVLKLIDRMVQLQSLVFQCKDDPSNYAKLPSADGDDELLQWFREHLPSSCLIARQSDQTSILQLWIR